MALTLTTTLRNAIADAVDAAINGGGGAGYLEFQTSGDVEVATITFDATAFGNAATGVITMASAPKSDSSATGGTMAKFRIFDNGAPGTELLSGTVSTSGADINFAGGLAVGAGDTVELTSFTITCPAS
jgi:hypothetical protein